jgi:IS5 family transposase
VKLQSVRDGLRVKGYIARGGQIVDATIVSAPKQRNSKDENEAIKAGKTPGEWEKKPAKNAQKDKDARWTKKHGQSFYGYKNHIGVDKLHKIIRKWAATDASPHDSQKLDDILDPSNTGSQVWADSAYRSAEIEAKLAAKGLKSRIHRRAARNRPLSQKQEAANTVRSKVRARVEHVFGHQENSMGRKIVRTIGMARARFKIGMMNLGYNMRRLVQLKRAQPPPAQARQGGACCTLSSSYRSSRLHVPCRWCGRTCRPCHSPGRQTRARPERELSTA